MLHLIPRHPRKISTSEIMKSLRDQGFVTTERSIQRDLQNLSSRGFALTVDDRSRPYGWSWAKGAKILDIPGMEPHTALAFKLAEQFLTPIMAPATLGALHAYFKQADQILKATPSGVSEWPSKVRIITRGQRLLPPKGDPDVLATTYQALFEGKQLECRYRRRTDSEIKDYHANPLGLVFRDGVIYLVCTLYDYDNVLQLAMHRMITARVTHEAVSLPKEFDLDGYLRSGGLDFPLGKPITLDIEMKESTAKHLEETPLSEDQKIRVSSEGWVRISATVPDTEQLKWWILGFGGDVRVIGPKNLRSRVTEALENAIQHYQI